MEFIVTRIAKSNPTINGRKLYLTHIGLWSLDPDHALRFKTEAEAKLWPGDDMRVEVAQ